MSVTHPRSAWSGAQRRRKEDGTRKKARRRLSPDCGPGIQSKLRVNFTTRGKMRLGTTPNKGYDSPLNTEKSWVWQVSSFSSPDLKQVFGERLRLILSFFHCEKEKREKEWLEWPAKSNRVTQQVGIQKLLLLPTDSEEGNFYCPVNRRICATSCATL